METNSLYYFSEAAKDLNFTKTAKRLFLSQQNLSNHIARLEHYYGVALFERKPCLTLTYSGEVLLAYANNLKMEEDNLKNVLSDIKERERGHLRIGSSPIRTSIVMPVLAEIFAGEYPNVELAFYHYHTDELADMLLSGELDFAVSVDKIRHPSLISTPVFTDSVYLMVSKNLLKTCFGTEADGLISKSRGGADLRDFVSLPFVNIKSTRIISDCFASIDCKPHFIVTTTFPQFSLPNFYENIAASIVTRTIYLHIREYAPDHILFFPLLTQESMSLHDIACIRHRRKYLSKHGQRFLDITVNYFKHLNEL